MYFPPGSTPLQKARDVVLVGLLVALYTADYAWAKLRGRPWVAFVPVRTGR